jgi:epoxyqueuosine reductase
MTVALRAMGLRVRRGSGTSDRWAAARSGVARLARNTFAVTERGGSWVNIECWRVNAEIPPDSPTLDDPCPVGCRRCLEACPTGALCAPRVVRMDRCIAWLTFRAPWPVDPALWARMGPWIYGCDDCQTVCPLNRGRWVCRRSTPWLEDLGDLLTPEGIARMSDDEYRARLHPLFGYIPAGDAERWRANARRALASKTPKATGC